MKKEKQNDIKPGEAHKVLVLACADRRILSRWKKALSDREKVFTVDNFLSLKTRLRAFKKATVILHKSLPGLAAQQQIIQLVKEHTACGFMVLEDIPNEHLGIELVREGVLGYANTHIKPELLREAMRVIELGEVWVSKRLLHWMVSHCREFDGIKNDLGSYLALDTLTRSERHVAECLAEGNNNKQIARRLNITERTVKAHLTSIYGKTGVRDRLHLALLVHNYAMA